MMPERRHRRDERVGLEPLAQEVGRAHGHELDEHRLLALGQLAGTPAEPGQRQPLARIERGQVGRHDRQDRLDEPGHVDHQLAVLLVGLGIVGRPAAELAHRRPWSFDPPQVVVVERRDRAVERKDVQAVRGQVELADDLGAQQRHDVAEATLNRKPGKISSVTAAPPRTWRRSRTRVDRPARAR